MAAVPAHAASTWSMTPWRRQISPTRSSRSNPEAPVVPTVATTRAGAAPAAASRSIDAARARRSACRRLRRRDRAQALAPEPGDAHRLLDGGMGLDRRVEPEPVLARYPAAVRREPGRPLAGGEDRAQGRARRGVLDDPREALRKPEHLPQPVEDAGLELGAGRATSATACSSRRGSRSAFRRAPRAGSSWRESTHRTTGAASA